MRAALTGLLLLGSGSAVFAHAHLKDSSPADGSSLSIAPAALVLEFSESAQLAILSLQNPDGTTLKLSAPEVAQARISIALPPLAPGTYLVRWRVQGSDGHVVPGQIRFTLRP
jgi:copper resistance protein C